MGVEMTIPNGCFTVAEMELTVCELPVVLLLAASE